MCPHDASVLLNSIDAPITRANDTYTIGLRRARDGQGAQSLSALQMDELPVSYLDEDGTPESYKTSGKLNMKTNRQNSTESTIELATQKAEVITALVRGSTVTDATRQANVDRTTFYLWLKSDEGFQAELNRAKQERIDVLRSQIGELAGMALSTIRDVLTGTDVPPGVKLKAALAVLQSIGTLGPEQIGETDPDVIRERTMFDIPGFPR